MDTIERLAEVSAELKEHATRLRARASEILRMAESATGSEKELLKLVSQSFTEQVDTSLEFQQEIVTVLGTALEEVGGAVEAEAGLEPEDAEKILGVLTSYRSMLDELMVKVGPEERLALQPKLDECLGAITLVEELTLEDVDDDEAAN